MRSRTLVPAFVTTLILTASAASGQSAAPLLVDAKWLSQHLTDRDVVLMRNGVDLGELRAREFGRLDATACSDLPVRDCQVPCRDCEPRVGRPERQSPHQGRRQEMRIDPANTEPVQPAVPDELDDLAVRHDWRLMHLLVVRQQLLPSSLVPDQEFAVNELMAADLVAAQEPIQLIGEWLAVGKEANPDRRVHEDDHAAERLPDLTLFRRRGTSRA